MEVKVITELQRQALRNPLPKEAIKPHPTKTFLSTIKAIYVVERLNDVFGVGEWKIENEIVVMGGKMIVVKAVFSINDYNVRVEQFGGNDNNDLGDAYKGAATDALTKIGSYLEIGIDVFKGLSDHPVKAAPAKPAPSPSKRTLIESMPEFNDAVKYIAEGGKFDKIKEKYIVTEAIEDRIIQKSLEYQPI